MRSNRQLKPSERDYHSPGPLTDELVVETTPAGHLGVLALHFKSLAATLFTSFKGYTLSKWLNPVGESRVSQINNGTQNLRESVQVRHRQVMVPVLDPATGKPSGEPTAAAELVIAISATFTAEPVRESLAYWLGRLGSAARIEFAPDNQVFHELLDPASLLARNTSGMNVILVRLEDWNVDQEAAEKNARELIAALHSAAARSSVAHLLCFCPADSEPLANFHKGLEERICGELAESSGIQCVTSAAMEELYPVVDRYDSISDKLGHIPYTPEFYAALGTLVARRLFVSHMAPRKVIVLDCDNTLWSGVCGEMGPAGIAIDEGRRLLQEFMREQISAGMILCTCSKNEEEDVVAVFRLRKEMPLQREHFVGWRVNWNPKSQNLRSLAKELNLGLDSFIFVDDNPVECAEVRAHCPEVLTVQLPETDIASFLRHMWAFDHVKVTDEDRQRTEMYRQNALRQQFQSKASSLIDFLASLELEIVIEEMKPAQLARTAQLTQRTNQFNFSTRRRSEGDIQKLRAAPGCGVLTVTVRDRFGDYGLVGLMIYTTSSEAIGIDTFLLSCRVLSRGVEHRMLARLGELAEAQSLKYVDAHFIRSAKNKPALDFLGSCGGQFREGTAGQMTFRIPAEMAAGLVFEPSGAVLDTMEETPKASKNAASSTAAFDWSALGWIAANSTDVHRILSDVEATGVKTTDASKALARYVAPRTETERQVARMWEGALRVSRVGVDDDFFALGGDSLEAVIVLSQVEKLTGKSLPMLTFLEAPTVAKLAAILDGTQAEREWQSLVSLKAAGSRRPFYCVHEVGGNILEYRDLAKYMDADQPFYGIQEEGLNGKRPRRNLTVEEMATNYLKEVRAFQPEGPYCLGGGSFGGWVAFEMARQLRATGQEVALLALFDTYGPGYPKKLPSTSVWQERLNRLRLRFDLHWGNLRAADGRQRLAYLREKAARWRRALVHRNRQRIEPFLMVLRVRTQRGSFSKATRDVNQAGHWAAGDYVPKPYAGRITLFRATQQPRGIYPDPTLGWSSIVQDIQTYDTPGHHGAVVREPRARALAERLCDVLQQTQRQYKEDAVLAENGEEMLVRVEDAFGRRSRLSKLPDVADTVYVSCLKAGGPQTPVFWIPGGGGLSVIAFRRISSLIGIDRAVYGLEASIEQSRKPIDLRIKARSYVEALQAQWPTGPYYLFGFSAGSWLAYEMAVQLQALGHQSLLVIFDMTVRGYPGFVGKIGTAFEVLRLHGKKMRGLPVSSWTPFTRRIIQERFRRMRENSTMRNWNGVEDGLDLFTVAEYQNWRATETYRTSKLSGFSGDIRVVLAIESIFDGLARSLDPRLGWSRLARGRLDVFRVPGNHISMLQEPHVRALAGTLKLILSEADKQDRSKR